MRRLRAAVGRHCSLTLSLAALLLQLLAMGLFLALRARDFGPAYGQFYNVDAGAKVCLRRPDVAPPPNHASERLTLAPCQVDASHAAHSQRFRMDFEGRLFCSIPSIADQGSESPEDLCVKSDLRLHGCGDEPEVWVFTQGGGLVHVESALCLTRDPESRLSLSTCDNRTEQYWWYQLEGQDAPA